MIEITDLLSQIFEELPVKSLMRFKCVSKTWCSIIEDPKFVDAHRLRSHTRPGGISLLICNESSILRKEPEAMFLLDPEGELDHIALPNPANMISRWPEANHSRHVEGLVCYGNFIWNPSTRKAIKLPDQSGLQNPFFKGAGKYEILNEYMLGFDAPSKKYKVLSIYHVLVDKSETSDFSGSGKNQTFAQVLTLGTNSWRNLDGLPEQLRRGTKVIASCYINNIIFFLISFDQVSESSSRATTLEALLAFEVGNERFRTIETPKSDPSIYKIKDFLFEVSGRLGIRNDQNFISILEDYEKESWTNRNVSYIDALWESIPYLSYIQNFVVAPIGTIHTQEILFQATTRYDPIFFFYHNLDTGNTRFIRRLGFHSSFPELQEDIEVSKHVETVFPLIQV